MKADCPKCGSASARYEKSRTDLTLVCLCGMRKVVFSTLETIEIQHNDAGPDVKLPKPGTKLRRTLQVVSVLEEPNTQEITERLWQLGEEFSVSDVASYLTILRSKGLVASTTDRRGVAGGSNWCLTDAATDLLGV